MQLMELGDFQFEISTLAYQQLQRVSQYRWAKVDILNRFQALQATGRVNDTITLTGTYHHIFVSELQVNTTSNPFDDLREIAAKQEPQIMVSAKGNSLGYWVIESITEDQSDISVGLPRTQGFTITLIYFGERV